MEADKGQREAAGWNPPDRARREEAFEKQIESGWDFFVKLIKEQWDFIKENALVSGGIAGSSRNLA